MRYRIALYRSEEGFSASVPGLPGCWSQGATEAELRRRRWRTSKTLYMNTSTWSKTNCKEPKSARSRWRSNCQKIPGVNHLDAVRALEKAGFLIVRQGKHIVMSNGLRILTIPRHNRVNAFTLAGIVRDAGLELEQFRELL